jgi:hypothetical protein
MKTQHVVRHLRLAHEVNIPTNSIKAGAAETSGADEFADSGVGPRAC